MKALQVQQVMVPNLDFVSLIEEQAEMLPHACAVIVNGDKTSYRQLNRRANKLARYLLHRGLGPSSKVAVLLPLTTDFIVALLAVLKIGGSYLALDSNLSASLLNTMVVSAGVEMVLTDFKQRHLFNTLANPKLTFMGYVHDDLSAYCGGNIESPIDPRLPACTSLIPCYGTREHKIVDSRVDGEEDIVLQQINISRLTMSHFLLARLDRSTRKYFLTTLSALKTLCLPQLFLPIIQGATLVLVPCKYACDAILAHNIVN